MKEEAIIHWKDKMSDSTKSVSGRATETAIATKVSADWTTPVLGAQRWVNRPDARHSAPQDKHADRRRETTQQQRAAGAAEKNDEGREENEHRNERTDVSEDAADTLTRKPDEKQCPATV